MEKLRKYIKNRGLIQAHVCIQVGTTPANFSAIVNGKAKPSLKIAYAIQVFTKGAVKMEEWVEQNWKDYIHEINIKE